MDIFYDLHLDFRRQKVSRLYKISKIKVLQKGQTLVCQRLIKGSIFQSFFRKTSKYELFKVENTKNCPIVGKNKTRQVAQVA